MLRGKVEADLAKMLSLITTHGVLLVKNGVQSHSSRHRKNSG
jgi:hypothetical protein